MTLTTVKRKCPFCGRMKAGLYFHIRCKHPELGEPPQPHPMQTAAAPGKGATDNIIGLYERLVHQYDSFKVDSTFAPNLQILNRMLSCGKPPGDISPKQLESIRHFLKEMKRYRFDETSPVLFSMNTPPAKRDTKIPSAIGTTSKLPQYRRRTDLIDTENARRMTFAELSIYLNGVLDSLRNGKATSLDEVRIKELLGVLKEKLPPWATTSLSLQILNRLRSEFPAFLQSGDENESNETKMAVEKLPWKFLPPGQTGKTRLFKAVREFRRNHPELKIDESRLKFAYGLKPLRICVGADEFDGYFAFEFRHRALLENPIEGNAAYVFAGDWESLSKFSKIELLHNHGREVKRRIHIGRWKSRIKKLLKLR